MKVLSIDWTGLDSRLIYHLKYEINATSQLTRDVFDKLRFKQQQLVRIAQNTKLFKVN